MTSHLRESLENLRLRATCAICTELYTKPKQLPNCSHVFCLLCVKRYMQAKLPNNFPPCPMCRTPITRAIRYIDLMEPARAEEDIIEFVRPYENCDLCKKRERPTLRCLECSGLICEQCQPVHGKLQSHHTVVSIFESGMVVQRQVIKNECKAHPNQTLDLYCLMCNTMLCLYCDKYAHSSCNSAYGAIANYQQKLHSSSQLLQDFVYSSEERKTLISSLEEKYSKMRAERTFRLDRSFGMFHNPSPSTFRTMSPVNQAISRMQHLPTPENIGDISNVTPTALRVVRVNEFSAFVRIFLRGLTEEIEKDVEFYNEYIDKMANIVGSEAKSPELNERKKNLETEVKELIKKGERILENNRLTQKETDVEVAKSAMRLEIASLQFFRLRKTFSLDIRCIEIALEKMNHVKPIIRQKALCAMQEHARTGANCLFIDREEVSAPDNYSSNENRKEEEQKTIDIDGKFTADRFVTTENDLIFNTVKCLSVGNNDEYTRRYSNCDNSYANRFSENAERLQVLIKGGLGVNKVTIDENGFTSLSGYHDAKPIENKCLDKCKYSKKRSCVNIVISAGPSVLKYQTYLVNVFFAAPFSYSGNTIIRIGDIKKIKSLPMLCLIGMRCLDSGIESLFLASDEGKGPILTHGIVIRAKIVRFKQTDFSCNRGTSVSDIDVYSDTAGLYCLLKGKSFSGRSLVTYTSNVGQSNNATVYNIPKDGPDIPISISCLKAELLCEMKAGVFFVSRDEGSDAVAIGRLIMADVLTKENIFTVTKTDTPIRTDKLRPLTMAESKHEELVVACAVDGDASKIAMIVPMKETFEILEILYPDLEHNQEEIVDMEMDSDGNIMCISKDVNGKMWRVITKYIMP